MDNSGWLDIFVANGHVYPQVDTIPDAAHFRQPILLFRTIGMERSMKLHPPRGLNSGALQSSGSGVWGHWQRWLRGCRHFELGAAVVTAE